MSQNVEILRRALRQLLDRPTDEWAIQQARLALQDSEPDDIRAILEKLINGVAITPQESNIYGHYMNARSHEQMTRTVSPYYSLPQKTY